MPLSWRVLIELRHLAGFRNLGAFMRAMLTQLFSIHAADEFLDGLRLVASCLDDCGSL
jgi:hypothetical protein